MATVSSPSHQKTTAVNDPNAMGTKRIKRNLQDDWHLINGSPSIRQATSLADKDSETCKKWTLNDMENGLLALYKFPKGSSSPIPNATSSSSSHTFKPLQAPSGGKSATSTDSQGIFQKAVHIKGKHVNPFLSKSSQSLKLSGDRTLFGWVKRNDSQLGRITLIQLKRTDTDTNTNTKKEETKNGTGSTTPTEFRLELDYSNGRLVFSDAIHKDYITYAFNTLANKTWYLFAVSYDSEKQEFFLYVNGQLQGSVKATTDETWSDSHPYELHCCSNTSGDEVNVSVDVCGFINGYKLNQTKVGKWFTCQVNAASTDNIGKPDFKDGPDTPSHPSSNCVYPSWEMLEAVCHVLCNTQYTKEHFNYLWVDKKSQRTSCYISENDLKQLCQKKSDGGWVCGPTKDCKYGSWRLWSACTRTCAGGSAGTRTRRRPISQYPQNGGARCEEFETYQEVPCNQPEPLSEVRGQNKATQDDKNDSCMASCTNNTAEGYSGPTSKGSNTHPPTRTNAKGESPCAAMQSNALIALKNSNKCHPHNGSSLSSLFPKKVTNDSKKGKEFYPQLKDHTHQQEMFQKNRNEHDDDNVPGNLRGGTNVGSPKAIKGWMPLTEAGPKGDTVHDQVKRLESNFPVKCIRVYIHNQTVNPCTCICKLRQIRNRVSNPSKVKLAFVSTGKKGTGVCYRIEYTGNVQGNKNPENITDHLLLNGAFEAKPAGHAILDGPCTHGQNCQLSDWQTVRGCPPCRPPSHKTQVRTVVHPARGNGCPCSAYKMQRSVKCKGLPTCKSQHKGTCYYGPYPSNQPSGSVQPCKALVNTSQSIAAERNNNPSGVVWTSQYRIPDGLRVWGNLFSSPSEYMAITRYAPLGITSHSENTLDLLGLSSFSNVSATPTSVSMWITKKKNENGHRPILRMANTWVGITLGEDAPRSITLSLQKCAQSYIRNIGIFDQRTRGIFWVKPVDPSDLSIDEITHWCSSTLYYKKEKKQGNIRVRWVPSGIHHASEEEKRGEEDSTRVLNTQDNHRDGVDNDQKQENSGINPLAAECKAISKKNDDDSSTLNATQEAKISTRKEQSALDPSPHTSAILSFVWDKATKTPSSGTGFLVDPTSGTKKSGFPTQRFQWVKKYQMFNGEYGLATTKNTGVGEPVSVWSLESNGSLLSWFEQSSWTLAFWVQVPKNQDEKPWTIFQVGYEPTAQSNEKVLPTLQFYADPQTHTVSLFKNLDASEKLPLQSISVPADSNLWQNSRATHVAIQRQNAKEYRLYIDGAIVASDSNSKYNITWSPSSSRNPPSEPSTLRWLMVQGSPSHQTLALGPLTFWSIAILPGSLRRMVTQQGAPSPQAPGLSAMWWNFRQGVVPKSNDTDNDAQGGLGVTTTSYTVTCAGGSVCNNPSQKPSSVTVEKAALDELNNGVEAMTFMSGSKGVVYGKGDDTHSSLVSHLFSRVSTKGWTISFWWIPRSFADVPLRAFYIADASGRTLEWTVDPSMQQLCVARDDKGQPITPVDISDHQYEELLRTGVPSFISLQRVSSANSGDSDAVRIFLNGRVMAHVPLSTWPSFAEAQKKGVLGMGSPSPEVTNALSTERKTSHMSSPAYAQTVGEFVFWSRAWNVSDLQRLYQARAPVVKWEGGMYHCTRWRLFSSSHGEKTQGNDSPLCSQPPVAYYHMFSLQSPGATLEFTLRGTLTPREGTKASYLRDPRQQSGGSECPSRENKTEINEQKEEEEGVLPHDKKNEDSTPSWIPSSDGCQDPTSGGAAGVVHPGEFVLSGRLENVQVKSDVVADLRPSCMIQNTIWEHGYDQVIQNGQLPDIRDISSLRFDGDHTGNKQGLASLVTGSSSPPQPIAQFSLRMAQGSSNVRGQSLANRLRINGETETPGASDATNTAPSVVPPSLSSLNALSCDFSNVTHQRHYSVHNTQSAETLTLTYEVSSSQGTTNGMYDNHGMFGGVAVRCHTGTALVASSVPSLVRTWWTRQSDTQAKGTCGALCVWICPYQWHQGSANVVQQQKGNGKETGNKGFWFTLFQLHGEDKNGNKVVAERYCVNPTQQKMGVFQYKSSSTYKRISIFPFDVSAQLPHQQWTCLTVVRNTPTKRIIYVGRHQYKTVHSEALDPQKYVQKINTYSMSFLDFRGMNKGNPDNTNKPAPSVSLDGFVWLMSSRNIQSDDVHDLVDQKQKFPPSYKFPLSGGVLAKSLPERDQPALRTNVEKLSNFAYQRTIRPSLVMGPSTSAYLVDTDMDWFSHFFRRNPPSSSAADVSSEAHIGNTQRNKDWTISFWFHPIGQWSSSDTSPYLLAAFMPQTRDYTAPSPTYVGVAIDPSEQTFTFSSTLSGKGLKGVNAAQKCPSGKWTHVCVTRKEGATLKVYVDGSRVGTYTDSSGETWVPDNSFWTGSQSKNIVSTALVVNRPSDSQRGAVERLQLFRSCLSSGSVETIYKQFHKEYGSPINALVDGRIPRDLAARINTQCQSAIVGYQCQFVDANRKHGYYLHTGVGAWEFYSDLTQVSPCDQGESPYKSWKKQRAAQTPTKSDPKCCFVEGKCRGHQDYLYYRLQQTTQNRSLYDPNTGKYECPSVCPYNQSYCNWTSCSTQCGMGHQLVMRQPRTSALSCRLAEQVLSQPCQHKPCPRPCPYAFNGNMCFHPRGGTCNSATGQCQCKAGFTGAACDAICPRGANGRVCSGNGTCMGSGRCSCKNGYSGPACETQKGAYVSRLDAVYAHLARGESVRVWENKQGHTGKESCGNNKRNCTVCWPMWKSYTLPRRSVRRTRVKSPGKGVDGKNTGKCPVGHYYVHVTDHYSAPPASAALMYLPGRECVGDLVYNGASPPLHWTLSGSSTQNAKGNNQDSCYKRDVIIDTTHCMDKACQKVQMT